jgi:pyridoxamine 5'-phosphate oxidase
MNGWIEGESASGLDELFRRDSPQAPSPGRLDLAESEVLRNREELVTRFAEGDIPLPPFWGGYRLRPDTVEFWQGRESRLHDRLRYRQVDDAWVIERLAP